MKTILSVTALLATLLLFAPSRSSAIEDILLVTRDIAKELKFEFQAEASGPEVIRITLEFPKQGSLDHYSYAVMEIHDGRRLVASALLKEEQAKPDRIRVSFNADRARLDHFKLRVVTEDGLARAGHVIAISDFIGIYGVR